MSLISKALQRITASKVEATSGKDWFDSLTPKQQKDYLELHPNSRYRKNGVKLVQKKTLVNPPKTPELKYIMQPNHAKGHDELRTILDKHGANGYTHWDDGNERNSTLYSDTDVPHNRMEDLPLSGYIVRVKPRCFSPWI